ncbi:Ubiquitin-conjugating enzyme E2 11 [Anabarilius grahami]|uniref:Ubiquitin-conjugating enzyme E2 11 n=1 Tax=Anabarilius grahami TaxID=495550 RepID=A0A3N0XVC9_ANAGA|nr:Ubiquitin-conjugating enzyme E2 11 [Anabarilius grahami]
MDEVLALLKNYRLEKFYEQFVERGIEDVRDFIDGVTDEDLDNMDMDPFQNTVEDLLLRIGIGENIGDDMTVCLFTAEGMPLTDDPFFNTWSLKDRHIDNGSELYAIFTPKENLRGTATDSQQQDSIRNKGPNTVFCHVMLKGRYDIHVNLDCDTLIDLRGRLSLESGIPSHVLHLKDYDWNVREILYNLGIREDTVLQFSLSSFHGEVPEMNKFCQSDIAPSVKQTEKGLSAFFSVLNAIRIEDGGDEFKEVIAYIRKISGCNALAQILFQVMCQNVTGTRVQKIAIVEGLYYLFRELLPSHTKRSDDRIIEDMDVFEYASVCWAYLMSQAKDMSTEHENYTEISMKAPSTNQRFCEPVRVPGVPEVFERMDVLDVIREGGTIPNCSELNLNETSLKKATDVEKILLSLPPFIESFPLWMDCDGTTPDSSFNINPEETFAQMNKKVEDYSHLVVTPPLQLKAFGVCAPRLILLSPDRFGMYSYKDKGTPQSIVVFEPLAGKHITVNIDELANKLRDVREDLTFKVSKTPKEAIVVLLDSSSSMGEECFDKDCKIKRIEAIKEIFDSFANRCMAYNFEQVICLVKFDSVVKTLHTFTETVETFKEHVHALQPSGATLLYDALNRGCKELNQIRQRFPDCRCRILCLTDGNDCGSMCLPVDIAKKLMSSKIVVDAVLIGAVHNTELHGISNVTGGCCFKPETSKEALQLFEMETVLSMELRKEKKHFDVSSINTVNDLNIFRTCGYDVKPEVKLPPQIHNKVTLTKNALKKRIMESKTGIFLEKDRRILEELKNLHCDPHPFCTVLPSEADFTFWKVLMRGPPDTPYEDGVFELYCEFGPEYPIKPPLVRFVTPVYHCNVNNVGRICHNVFDRNYSAHITMREILDAIFGLLIAPEPEDPLDSILAEEFQSNKHKYEEEAKKSTKMYASSSLDDLEKKYVGPELQKNVTPPTLTCPLSHKLFVDPVKTTDGMVYERSAIEDHVKQHGSTDPLTEDVLQIAHLKPDLHTKKAAKEYRMSQIKEKPV